MIGLGRTVHVPVWLAGWLAGWMAGCGGCHFPFPTLLPSEDMLLSPFRLLAAASKFPQKMVVRELVISPGREQLNGRC